MPPRTATIADARRVAARSGSMPGGGGGTHAKPQKGGSTARRYALARASAVPAAAGVSLTGRYESVESATCQPSEMAHR